jgi:hypothetical protein
MRSIKLLYTTPCTSVHNNRLKGSNLPTARIVKEVVNLLVLTIFTFAESPNFGVRFSEFMLLSEKIRLWVWTDGLAIQCGLCIYLFSICEICREHCTRIEVECISTSILVQPTDITRNIPTAVCGAPPEDEQVMLETCRGP